MKVLSVQIPAPCPLNCNFCRTPSHNEGDPEKIFQSVKDKIKKSSNGYEEVYITSNGETGLSVIFDQLIHFAEENELDVSVLCATEFSVVKGLCRVEISLNQYTEALAIRAVEKAKRLGVPVVISMVDTDTEKPISLNAIMQKYEVDGVLVRALQAEGRSFRNKGSTRWLVRPGVELGNFPVTAYREFEFVSAKNTICLNHDGIVVPMLGGVQ